MTDSQIIDLYFRRSGSAIEETDKVYGRYCYAVAYNVLENSEDSEEALNDTWLAAWNAIPPTVPDCLKAFLGKLARRISISRLRKTKRVKRGGKAVFTVLEELQECIPSDVNVEREMELRELSEAVSTFLETLTARNRTVFVARYWHVMPVKEIAWRLGMKENTVKTSLARTRENLKTYLKKEGLC